MIDSSIIILVITLVIIPCIVAITKVCECLLEKKGRCTEIRVRRDSTTSRRTSIYIIEEDNGDVFDINPRAADIEKYELKQSYKNLAPPPYVVVLKTLAASSYELPPSYPIDT